MSATAVLLPLGQQQFFDANGDPLAGGSVVFFVPNTNTLKDTWQDPGQAALNTNPVLLDASGSATIYGTGDYVQVVRDVAGTVQWTKLTSSDTVWPTIVQLGGAGLADNNVWTGYNQFNATVTMYGAAMDWSEAPSILSDTEIDLQTMAGNKGSLTLGTANPIESVILNQGAIRFMRFLTPISLTPGPLFVMPAGLTAARTGDCCIFEGEAGGRVRISLYQRADGGPVSSGATSGSASSSINGNFRNLLLTAVAGVGTGAVTVGEITLQNIALKFATGRELSLAFNSGATGLNGLDTGTVAGDTWYAVYVISDGGGNFATLLSLEPVTPDPLPTGYGFYTRVGWIRTTATPGAFLGSRQRDRSARWVVDGAELTGMRQLLGGSQGDINAPTWVTTSVTSFVPSTARALVAVVWGKTGEAAMIAPNDNYGAIDDEANPPLSSISTVSGTPVEVLLESSNVYGATQSNGRLFAYGWEDT